jgi:cytochrome c oxidase subunit 3
MATTVHEPPQIGKRPVNGNGGAPPFSRSADQRAVKDRPSAPSRTGIWVGLAAITMTFAALTSALIVRQGSSNDWQPISLPRILFFNTAVLVFSSITLEVARRKVASFIRNQGATRREALGWFTATLGLGLIFVAGQYAAWIQLRSEGLFLATNPNSSFFYVLTAVHAIHVLGGLAGLTRVIRNVLPVPPTLRKSTIDSTALYWHFMGALWVYLMFVLWLKL